MDFFSPERMAEVNGFLRQLGEQDDRSLVIMTAARLESLLNRAIEKRLVEPRNKGDTRYRLSFPQSISLSHRLGLVHRLYADALDHLNKIRNEAAHFDSPFALSDPKLRQWIEGFARPWSADTFNALYHGKSVAFVGKERFRVSASIFFVYLSPLESITTRLEQLPVVRLMEDL